MNLQKLAYIASRNNTIMHLFDITYEGGKYKV